MRADFRIALALRFALLLPGCSRRESLDDARARASGAALIHQIADLQGLIAKAERGELTTQNRIAIGIAEETTKALFDASLPREELVGDRVYVRIEAALPLFRGNNAGVVLRATARGKTTGARARLELGGRLVNFRIKDGRLIASIELAHLKVLDTSLGEIGSDVLEGLLRDNLDALARLTPALEVPVHLQQSIAIAGLDEGVVTAKPGVLPLEMTLAEVIPVNQRLWVLLDVKAGPWRRVENEGKHL